MNHRSEIFTTPALDGVRLHALHWGNATRPLLVLLHGGGANAHWWDHLAPALAESLHVVALDFRGHGDSDHPERLVVGAFEDDLHALLEHLGHPEILLVGHSMGGFVALAHAAVAPSTQGLVVIDVARDASPRARRRARLALSLRRHYRSRSQAVERFNFLPAAKHVSPALRRAIAEHSVHEVAPGRFAFKFDPRWFGVPSRPPPPLDRILCPTLVIRGAESRLLSHRGACALVEELPRARLVEIENAGHHTHLDRPQAVLAELRSFLDRPR